MKNIRTECCFYSVGQGLFYTGTLYSKDDTFSFVYDCGSLSINRLKDEINFYKKQIKNHNLDLMILSNFNEDHINGIPYLIKDFKINKIIMPYYSIFERLIQTAFFENFDIEINTFMCNPIDYLKISNINNIIYLTDNNYLKTDDEDYEKENKHNYERYDLIKEDLLWEFHFNYVKDNIIDHDFLAEKIKQNLKENNINIKDAFFDKKVLNSIKEDFIKIGIENYNNTSVLFYHGPLNYGIITKFNNYLNLINRYHNLNKCGTLLTGEACVNKANDFKNILEKIHKVSVLQVPQHGGSENWSKYDWHSHTFDTYVISYGIDNKFDCPAPDVINELKLDDYKLVNEYNRYTYSIFA